MSKKKIVFICETATLAHPSRSLTLAASLNPSQYEVVFYADTHYDALLSHISSVRHENITSTSPALFAKRLAKGEPLYNTETIKAYLVAEKAILEREKPDLVVGDFRITLQISARLQNVPYLNIADAHWSPHAQRRYRIPPLPIAKIIGYKAGDFMLNLFSPLLIGAHARPMNEVRKMYGLPSLGNRLEDVYTQADYVAYCEPPSLYPLPGLPQTHRYIGPVLWSPDMALPPWWGDIPRDKPVVYINLGSSGNKSFLPELCKALAVRDFCTLIVATATNEDMPELTEFTPYTARYLPSNEGAKIADIMICNGGTPSTMLGVMNSAYCIGVAANMDQLLNMDYIESAGLGRSFRADRQFIRDIVETCARQPVLPENKLAALRKEYETLCPKLRFPAFVENIVS